MTPRGNPGYLSRPMATPIPDFTRSHMCGDLRAEHEGQDVVLMGWVHYYRDLGGAVFIDLRDRTGLCQVVFEEQDDKEVHGIADSLRPEWVVGIAG